MALLSAPPIFHEKKEAAGWHSAMHARHLWAEHDRAFAGPGLAAVKGRAAEG